MVWGVYFEDITVVGIALVDPAGTIHNYNREFARLVGDVAGKTVFDLIPTAYRIISSADRDEHVDWSTDLEHVSLVVHATKPLTDDEQLLLFVSEVTSQLESDRLREHANRLEELLDLILKHQHNDNDINIHMAQHDNRNIARADRGSNASISNSVQVDPKTIALIILGFVAFAVVVVGGKMYIESHNQKIQIDSKETPRKEPAP